MSLSTATTSSQIRAYFSSSFIIQNFVVSLKSFPNSSQQLKSSYGKDLARKK